MATQHTSMSSKKKILGIFPFSTRKFIIVNDDCTNLTSILYLQVIVVIPHQLST
jgi:hypothetical protein